MTQTAVIADDHALIRQGTSQNLTSVGLTIVGEAENGLEAVAQVWCGRYTTPKLMEFSSNAGIWRNSPKLCRVFWQANGSCQRKHNRC